MAEMGDHYPILILFFSGLAEPLKVSSSLRRNTFLGLLWRLENVEVFRSWEKGRVPFSCWLNNDWHSNNHFVWWGPYPWDGRAESLKEPGFSEAFMELHSNPGLLIPGLLCAIIKFYTLKSLLIWGFCYITDKPQTDTISPKWSLESDLSKVRVRREN